MAFTRPTLQELIDRVEADLVSRLVGGGTLLRNSVAKVIARTLAGAAHHLYGYISWMLKQVIPDTAEGPYLRRWAKIWGVTPKAAEFAEGIAVFTGTDGVNVPQGTEVQTSAGDIYETQALGVIASGIADITIAAQIAGAEGNLAAGTVLSLVSPIAGLDSSVTVDSNGVTGGSDEESDESLLTRLLARIQTPPNGGSENDYIAWAKEVSGVTRAWVVPQQFGPGTLALLFVQDEAEDIIPAAPKISEVQAHVDSVRPVTAAVTVMAPVAVPLNPHITISPSTDAVKAAVTAELKDLLYRKAEPGGTLFLSEMNEAISVATGESDHVLTAPSADITYTDLQVGTLGTVVWA